MFNSQDNIYQILNGNPYPLGVSKTNRGYNFSLFSDSIKVLKLTLFHPETYEPHFCFQFDPVKNKTGDIWHVCLDGLGQINWLYNYQIDDQTKYILDPMAKKLKTGDKWGQGIGTFYAAYLDVLDIFDWEETSSPLLSFQDLIIYELHVKGFTQQNKNEDGCYLEIIKKIPYLKFLGVNAIQLMPVFEFDETDCAYTDPETNFPLKNFWGYAPLNFFSPMRRYGAPDKTDPICDFKKMVKELHKNNIEVILDVVFNHTGEKDQKLISMRSLAKNTYYMIDEEGKDRNYSGCGNTLNVNHPVVAHMILESLKYWVTEMKVDGFRFDLASIFSRDLNGQMMDKPLIIDLISKEPVFKNIKLIAEPWDAGGLYLLGHFPKYGAWKEWNDQFRDTVRRFIKGDPHLIGAFANVVTGSSLLYRKYESSSCSLNFITCHDGFSLRDLVSYNDKQNEKNGEKNRDGTNQNHSWNCGHEGSCEDPSIQQLRERQMKNMIVALILSLGTPMICMGDEYGHTKNGNNNSYCQDNEINYFQWDLVHGSPLFEFYQRLILIRKKHLIFNRTSFFDEEEIDWYNQSMKTPDWQESAPFIAYVIKDQERKPLLFICFNAQNKVVDITLPCLNETEIWIKLVNTNDTSIEKDKQVEIQGLYSIQPFSSLVCLCRIKGSIDEFISDAPQTNK
ncbi:MAG: glycogen debranching protein [Rhabdochlamydiaceae bacterium]